MVTADLEDLSVEELRRRRRFAVVVLFALAVVLLVNIVIGVLRERGSLIAVAAALAVTGLPMFKGVQRINGELEKRESS